MKKILTTIVVIFWSLTGYSQTIYKTVTDDFDICLHLSENENLHIKKMNSNTPSEIIWAWSEDGKTMKSLIFEKSMLCGIKLIEKTENDIPTEYVISSSFIWLRAKKENGKWIIICHNVLHT